MTPYRYWRKTHAYHHAHSGDLDFRGFGDLDPLTVSEDYGKGRLGRRRYRPHRPPLRLPGAGGLFRATRRGPGAVVLQSLPSTRLAGRVLANIKPGGGKGEGSVLGGFATMFKSR